MRIILAIAAALLVGSSFSVAEARCYGRSYRAHRGHSHYGRSYRYRSYGSGHYYRRAFYPASRYYGYGRGHYGSVHRSYSYRRYYRYGGDCDSYSYGYDYGRHVYYGFNRNIRVAPIYGRLSTVFTLDDAVFDGSPKSDADGLPQRRAKPVGSRFLAD